MKYKLYLIGALLCLLASQSNAQYSYTQRDRDRAAYRNWMAYQKAKREGDNLLKWWRGEGTYGIALAGTLKFSERSKYDSTIYAGTSSFDTTIRGNAKPMLGFHANGNANYMLTRLGTSSILSLSVGIQANLLRWKYDLFRGTELTTGSTKLLYLQVGIPVTVDYKWGCDVDFQPEMKTCFAAGAGAMPALCFASDGYSNDASHFAVLPYVYASYGIYTGFLGCIKLRATYVPGAIDVYKDLKYNANVSHQLTMNAQTSNVFTIGIAFMEYSRDWGKGWARRGAHSGGGHHYHRHSSGMSRMF